MNYKFITSESLEFLEQLLKQPSTSGGEKAIAELYTSYMSSYGNTMIDNMYNSCCVINPASEFKIMLDAHYDEVGLQVVHIADNGFIYFRRNGWIDHLTLLGQEVTIIGKKKNIDGVIGKKPIHLSKPDDKNPDIDDMWIDTGLNSREEVVKYVSVGDLIVYKSNVKFMGDERIISKGLDDKIGVFIISQVIKQLAISKINLNVGIYGCASAQEEVGGRGCIIMSHRIKPNIAFCLDVGFSTDIPGLPETKYGHMYLGEGVVICHSCDNNKEMTELLEKVAIENEIPYQPYTTLSPTGGTDTCKIQLIDEGVKTALLAIPNRYMHTPIEMCDLRDVDAAIGLLFKVILALNKDLS
ncbi:M20/M25/M40 family metallo-hydrolase [uncultured Bacteroides sp.]|uniref:M20/M25/M40 family metallo-hydrolase n=1 Tax=uncultured Bacteroides sp. TaxID=162156 RepID=UPI0027D964B6|nr:M20/M25/M40 family metallo-hydrolase [uncultured Bacteroides sp.]